MTLISLADGSALVMVTLLLMFLLIVFTRERTRWSVVYLIVVVNFLFLCLSLWLMDGEISYLSDINFIPYYKKALLLEAIFWATFTGLFALFVRVNEKKLIYIDQVRICHPVQLLFLTAITILALEITISSGTYFKPYTNSSDTGTIAYELGCLLLALAIVLRADFASRARILMFEVVSVGLALFIVLGSGKRLPFAYVIIAYLFLSLRHYGKMRTTLLYLGISMIGFVLGLARDFMTIDSINSAILSAGFGSSNQGAVLHASAVYLRVADEGLSTVLDRGISFLSNFLGALLLPISLLPEQTQVNIVAMKYYNVQGNGGFIGAYSYYFLDWVGPIFMASVLAWLCSRQGRWAGFIVTIILLTSPRWTLYNVGPVLRLISMTLIILALVYYFYKLFFVSKRHLL